jgi:uncharacterized repeat protein (TIGR03803 family)
MMNRVQHRVRAASGALVLAVLLAVGVIATPSAYGRRYKEKALYKFTGGVDGWGSYASLVRDAAGNLYGTAVAGGTAGYGVVFKLDTGGHESVLHSFTAAPDGANPFAGLVRDTVGSLYGTTAYGGSSDCTSGCGVVFKVDSSGTETLLHSFAGGTTDGCYPHGGLLRDKAGSLYGTAGMCGASGYGVIFKIDSNGTETVLHSFAGGSSDGLYPSLASLLMDKNGNLYGVTEEGGASNQGVAYELSKRGTLTVLYSFTGGTTDGCYPLGTPAMDAKGTLYGTTFECGSSNEGVLWKLSKGKETMLHSFAGPNDGAYPYAGVIIDAKGNLYGDAEEGGASNLGTVYKLSKTGTLTLLLSFAGSDGAEPYGGLIVDAKANVYGTTWQGGSRQCAYGCGTVWKLTP